MAPHGSLDAQLPLGGDVQRGWERGAHVPGNLRSVRALPVRAMRFIDSSV
jgi:hypothetical protein